MSAVTAAATPAATIQAAATAAPAVMTAALASSKFSCDWTQSIMIAGVAFAIMGLAAAIFTNSALAIIGFALLGISSGLGLFTAQNSASAQEIQQSITQMQQQNAALDAQRKQMEGVVKTITAENTTLKALRVQLEKSVAALRVENVKLVRLNTDLTRNVQALDVANRGLQDTKNQLEAKIAQLEQDLGRLKEEVQAFISQNVDYAAKVGVLTAAVGGLTTTEGNLRTDVANFDRTLGADLSLLSAQVALAKTVSVEVFSHMDAQQQQLKEQAVTLRREVSEVRALSDCLEARVAKFTSGEALIKERAEALATTEQQFLARAREERAGIERSKKELEEQIAKANAERTQKSALVVESEAELKAIKEQTAALAAEHIEQVALRQQQLADLEAQIKAKAALVAGLGQHMATRSGFDTPS